MRLVMMGMGSFAEPTFQAVLGGGHEIVGLVTQPDRVIGQERASTRRAQQGMKDIALAYQVPVFQPESINTAEGVAGMRRFEPDLLVVAAYGQILSNEVLSVPRHGGINVHASLLPRYRGAAPIAWAIYHGETRTGVSIIRMSIYLDAGEILAQEAIDIGPEETAGELEARLAPLGGRLAARVVDQIAAGPLSGIKQDKSQATKAPKLTKEHGLIDWNRSARDVCNHIRAMQPWPTAYTFLHEKSQAPQRLLIVKGLPLDLPEESSHTPGEVIMRPGEKTSLLVAASSQSAVDIVELQPAGKRRMTAVEYLRGHRLLAGARFGAETT
jgi:methionyl-tRNA formyltransferase